MSKSFATRFLIAVLACVLVPSLCEAASSVFDTGGGAAMCNGSALRLRFLAKTIGTPGQTETVKIVELAPTAQYNFMGTYYFSYSWSAMTVGNGTLYAYDEEVMVECFMNGSWVPYTIQQSNMRAIP